MKRLIACSLLLGGIYGCEKICGDLRPVVEPPLTGGAGAGGDGSATAGEGGAPSLPAGNGPGGVPSEAGGGAGGAAGGAGGDSCSQPDGASIITFDEDPSSLALGDMKSDDGTPIDQIATGWNSSTVYHESGSLPDETGNGFTFTFTRCVDISQYAGIRFDAQGSTPAGFDVSTAPGNFHNVAPQAPPVVCVPFATGQRTVEELRFIYAPPGMPAEVNLSVDNFAFYKQGECSET